MITDIGLKESSTFFIFALRYLRVSRYFYKGFYLYSGMCARAAMELKAWIQEAYSSGIRILKDAARMLSIWKPFILNWHKHRISTGKLEAINGKIGTLQRNAYGYRDDEYLKLRIFNLHNSTYALTG